MSSVVPFTVSFDPQRPPVGLLATVYAYSAAAAEAVKSSPGQGQPIVSSADGVSFLGSVQCSRFLGRLDSSKFLYGRSPVEATQIDFFLDYSSLLSNKDTLIDHIQRLDAHFEHNSFVSSQCSIGDFVVYECLVLNPRFLAFQKGEIKKFTHFQRWFNTLNANPAMASALKWKSEKEAAEKAKKLESSSQAHFDVDLPGAEMGKVCTRFPPEPSGYLHIGHAKALLLNDHIARMYNGKMILRFDDTNPKKEKEEYVENIIRDIKTLGISWCQMTHTSDHFELIYRYALEMIKNGKAYIDDTPVEQMRKERMEGIESKGRNQPVEENLRLFEEMKQATEIGLKCCLRAKIDMQAKNKAMRDPVIYRCNLTPHHRTGATWKIYPTYDLACPIVDAIEGVTHPLRTNEYRDRNEQFYWMIDALGLRKPVIRDYSRLNFVFTTLSKRKLTWFVDTKRVESWDDPRMPTVQGIIRRGMTVEALREFILGQGFSQMSNLMEWDKIWTINKRVLDPKAPRLTSISSDRIVPLSLSGEGCPTGTEAITVDLHPKNKAVGSRVLTRSNRVYLEQDDAKSIADNEEITLMNWGNAIITKITKDNEGFVTGLEGKLNPKGDVKTTDKKLTWLDASDRDNLLEVNLLEYDTLITVAKVEEEMNFDDIVRPVSKFETKALGEPAMRSLNKGAHIQIPRRGFYIVDQVYRDASHPLQLILIPDGKQKNISTLSSKIDKSQIFKKNEDILGEK